MILAVDAETGEALATISRDEAMRLTAEIKGHVGQIWRLLSRAHETRAYLAMGYTSWGEYVGAEFEMSRSYAYRLLDMGKVVAELESGLIAASWDIPDGVSPIGDTVPESQARVLAPLLGQPVVMAEAYIEATEAAEDEGREVTAADLKEAVDTRTPAIRAMHERKAREAAEQAERQANAHADQQSEHAGPTAAAVIDKVNEAFEDNHPHLALRSEFGKAIGAVHTRMTKFDLRAVRDAFGHGDELDRERPADFAADLRRWADQLDPQTLRSVK